MSIAQGDSKKDEALGLESYLYYKEYASLI